MSRLIKSHFTAISELDEKVISIRLMETTNTNSDSQPVFTVTEDERTRILGQAKQEAEAILSKALAEAEQIRENVRNEQSTWEQEKEKVIANAKEIGFNSGLLDGQNRGYEEYRELIQSARETVMASSVDYHNHIQASEKVILDIGLKVAGKILGKKIPGNEEDFLTFVKRALKNARDYKDIRLHIHPVHYQSLLTQKDELLAVFPKEIDFYIFPDDELTENSCIIESENGRIDACVDSQLEEIKQKLFELMEGEHS